MTIVYTLFRLDEIRMHDSLGKIPQQRDFSISVYNDCIQLIRHDGRKNSLNNYLPRGYSFSSWLGVFSCDHYNRTVNYDEQEIPNRSFLLSLCHEIGHAVCDARTFQKHGLSLDAVIDPDIVNDEYDRIRASQERAAWAYALHLQRKLEQKGYAVFAGWTRKEIDVYISMALCSYEMERLEILQVGFTPLYEKRAKRKRIDGKIALGIKI